MNQFTLLSALMRRAWLIDPQWAAANMALVANILQGKSVSFGNPEKRGAEQRVAILSRPEGATLVTPGYYSGFQNAPEGSLALIDVIGPIMKYGFCSDGSYEMAQMIKEADATPNIKGIFINMDSPGGQVDGTATLGDAIKNATKRSVTFVNDGMMCSAGLWAGTSADEVYASHDLNTIGSIGVYQTIYDQSKRLKDMGIKKIDRYAPQSTEKNKTYKDALAGKYKMLDDELFSIAEKFIETVVDNRGDRLQGSFDEWNKGQTGSANWATSVGLIDGLMSFEQAVTRLEQISGGTKSKRAASKPIKSAQINNPDMKFPKLTALAGKATVSQEELDEVNAELTEAGITGYGIYSETVITEAATATTNLATATATVTRLTGELATANTNVTNVTAENTTLKARISQGPAAAAPAVAPTDPVTEPSAAAVANAKVWDKPHNKAILSNPMFQK